MREETSLRELNDALHHAIEGIARFGDADRFAWTNRTFCALLGFESEELSGASWESVVRAEEHGKVRDARERARREGKADVEAAWVKKDGSSVLMNMIVASCPGEYWLIHDASPRRALEEELRQAQKMEAVGRLAGGVAHDFNNLLTAITGFGQLLQSRLPPGDPNRSYVGEILLAADRGAALTQQLLAFSRRQVLEPRPIDLNGAVRSAESLLRRLIGEHIEFVTLLDPAAPKILGDPTQLQQVLMNLAANARDAMPHGGTLMIETGTLDRAALLSVTDTGCGMDAQTRAHLFEPFFTTRAKGTGLGLATVYGIVKQSGGDIEASSEVGHGTRIKICLPRTDSGVAVDRPRGRAEGSRGTETVLVVEDSHVIRRLVREVLMSRGYQVLEAAGGDEALRAAQSHPGPIHLVLTDVVMPGMSGRETAVHLSGLRPESKVLYMSGFAEGGIEGAELKTDSGFLAKPFTPEELAESVRRLLDRIPQG